MKFITMIKVSSNKVILVADINKYVVDSKLAKSLRQIGLTEAFYRKFRKASPALYSSRSMKIDSVWLIDNIIPTNVSILPYKFSIGDHRFILVDFNINKIIGRRVKIYSPLITQLICKNQSTVDKYSLRVVELTGILLNAEKGCKKLRIDEVEYLPEVSKAAET